MALDQSGGVGPARKVPWQLAATGLLSILVGLVVVAGAMGMRVPPTYSVAGPTFAPNLIGTGLLLIGAGLVWRAWRERGNREPTAELDWPPVAALAAVLLLPAFLLVPLGWVIGAALMFAAASAVFGSRRHLLNFAIGLAFGAATQILFVAVLGLRLPSGILARFF